MKTSLKKKIRKIKLDFVDSVWSNLYEYNYYKNRKNTDFYCNDRHARIIIAMRCAFREFSEYEKWKDIYNKFKKIEKETNIWYKYLNLEHRSLYKIMIKEADIQHEIAMEEIRQIEGDK